MYVYICLLEFFNGGLLKTHKSQALDYFLILGTLALKVFLMYMNNNEIIPTIKATNAPTTAKTKRSPVNRFTIPSMIAPKTPNMSSTTVVSSDRFAIVIFLVV